jgi:hypothetical protein
MSMIVQPTTTFRLPEFFPVVKCLEDLSATPEPTNEPDY